jgi:hypothetical protein
MQVTILKLSLHTMRSDFLKLSVQMFLTALRKACTELLTFGITFFKDGHICNAKCFYRYLRIKLISFLQER